MQTKPSTRPHKRLPSEEQVFEGNWTSHIHTKGVTALRIPPPPLMSLSSSVSSTSSSRRTLKRRTFVRVYCPHRPLMFLLGALLFAFGSLRATEASAVTFDKNGFDNVVIAVGPEVLQDPVLLQSIKDAVTNASRVLFKATSRRAFFRSVDILLPRSWSSYFRKEVIRTYRNQGSDMRVGASHPWYNGRPYTAQPMGCGREGLYTLLSPDLFLNYLHGPPENLLAMEWAKLRWGVYDEVGFPNDPISPLFFPAPPSYVHAQTHLDYSVTACSNRPLNVTLIDAETGGQCTFLSSGLPTSSCRPVALELQTSTSSALAHEYLPKAPYFCTGHDGDQPHDPTTPTLHNVVCGGRSVWEVLEEHPDFANGKNPPMLRDPPDTEIQVVGVAEDPHFVMVLDYTSSMEDADRLQRLLRALRAWILREAPYGAWITLIKYSKEAEVVRRQVRLLTQEDRNNTANALQDSPDEESKRCSGCGLWEAQEVLGETSGVVLLSKCGPDNFGLVDALPILQGNRTAVVSLAFGTKPKDNIEMIAMETQGRVFWIPDGDAAGETIWDALDFLPTLAPADLPGDNRLTLHTQIYRTDDVKIEANFEVDSTVGRNLTLQVFPSSPAYVPLPPGLMGPGRTSLQRTWRPIEGLFTKRETFKVFEGEFDSLTTSWTVEVPEAEEGTWTYIIDTSTASSPSPWVLVRISTQGRSSEDPPVTAYTWTSSLDPGGVDLKEEPLSVFAQVARGTRPVVGAKVRAKVYWPDPNLLLEEDLKANDWGGDVPLEVDLEDDGWGADVTKGDGIYSHYVTALRAKGRYVVQMQVKGGVGTFINEGPNPSNANDTNDWCCGTTMPFDLSSATPTGSFSRHMGVGEIKIASSITEGILPPSRVLDLSATVSEGEDGFEVFNGAVPRPAAPSVPKTKKRLELAWTAPGDELDSGMVTNYEIRYASDPSALLDSTFESGNSTLLDDLNVEPTEAGNPVKVKAPLEKLALDDSSSSQVLYFALRAMDDQKRVSPASNIVSVVLESPGGVTTTSEPETTASEPTTTTTSRPTTTTTSKTVTTPKPTTSTEEPTTTSKTTTTTTFKPTTTTPSKSTSTTTTTPRPTTSTEEPTTTSETTTPTTSKLTTTTTSESTTTTTTTPRPTTSTEEPTTTSETTTPTTSKPTTTTTSESTTTTTTSKPTTTSEPSTTSESTSTTTTSKPTTTSEPSTTSKSSTTSKPSSTSELTIPSEGTTTPEPTTEAEPSISSSSESSTEPELDSTSGSTTSTTAVTETPEPTSQPSSPAPEITTSDPGPNDTTPEDTMTTTDPTLTPLLDTDSNPTTPSEPNTEPLSSEPTPNPTNPAPDHLPGWEIGVIIAVTIVVTFLIVALVHYVAGRRGSTRVSQDPMEIETRDQVDSGSGIEEVSSSHL